MILVLHDGGALRCIDGCVKNLISKGIVSAVSAFPLGKKFEGLAKFAQDHGVAVGAHLALTAQENYGIKPRSGNDLATLSGVEEELSLQLELAERKLGRIPDYYDSHCFVLRAFPAAYETMSRWFGIKPMIQITDPYTGPSYRLCGKLAGRTRDRVLDQVREFQKTPGFIFSHVGLDLFPSWAAVYATLMECEIDIAATPKYGWWLPTHVL